MSLEMALAALRQANRIDGTRASYRKDNPTEYDKVMTYLDGGARPAGADTFSFMGQGLVWTEDVRRGVPPPPPPPPPPTTGTVKRLDRLTDWQGIQNLYVRPAGGGWFSPTATAPPNTPWPDGGGVFQLADGMRFVATDKMTAPWADTSKLAIGAWDMDPTTFTGKHQVWEGEIEFPSGDNSQGWPMSLSPWSAAVLAEWETSAGSVGHQLQIDSSGRVLWAICQTTQHYPSSFYKSANPAQFDTRIPIRFELKWTGGTDGFMKADIGGVRLVDRSGVPTLFSGEGVRHHSAGWYGPLKAGVKNGVVFHNWRVTTL